MMMMPRWPLTAIVVTCATALAGCAPGEVALEGKIFEATGITQALQPKPRATQIEARTPLVLPPSLDRLPQPGSGDAVAAADPSFPVDPERRRVSNADAKAREQAEFCRRNYDRLKALGSAVEAESLTGPQGSCAPSILKSLTGTTAGESLQGTSASPPVPASDQAAGAGWAASTSSRR